mgnify:CR=1 FL=1
MTNVRGNTYSRGNRYYRSTDTGYWQHSLDELALVDLPTAIDYVLDATGHKQLGFIGFSQGCAIATMLLAAQPAYDDKIWLLLLVAPVVMAESVVQPFLRQQAMKSTAKVRARVGQEGPRGRGGRVVGKCWCARLRCVCVCVCV